MKAQSPARCDLRAFRWHLAPLERKLEANFEAARLARAVLQRQAEAVYHAIEVLVQQRRHALDSASTPRDGAIDTRAHARVLGYLLQVAGTIEGKHAEAGEVDHRIRRARQDCVDAERQLACIVRMREAAQAAYAAGQFRALAKEADMAWLALHADRERADVRRNGSGT